MPTLIRSVLFFFITLFSVIIPSRVFAASPPPVMTVILDGHLSEKIQTDTSLYISGTFTKVTVDSSPAQYRSYFAVIDIPTRTVSPLTLTIDGTIHDMIRDSQMLVLGGAFTQINGQAHPYMTMFDMNTQKIIPFPGSVDGPVYALEQFERTLYLGGAFGQVNGAPRARLAAFNLENNTLDDWNPGADDTVLSMLIYQNRLYVGGAFTRIQGQMRQHIASFLLPEQTLSSWSFAVDSPVQKIQLEDGHIRITGEAMEDNQQAKVSTITLDPDTSSAEAPTVIPSVPTATVTPAAVAAAAVTPDERGVVQGLQVDAQELGFAIPTLSDILTFAIRGFFVIAGLTALFYLLLGAFAWVTSGGDKDSVGAARDKIQAAIIGLLMMVGVLGVVWTMEQVVFARRICLGISCPVTIPSLLEAPSPE